MTIVVNGNHATLRSNKCTFTLKKEGCTAKDVLDLLKECLKQHQHASTTTPQDKINFVLTRKMHATVRTGTLTQRIEYLKIVGHKDEICRQVEFYGALKFIKFQNLLDQQNIENHFFNNDAQSKRIIAVSIYDVEDDEEVRKSLQPLYDKHKADKPIFVCCEESLKCALLQCLPGSTLVIDGHWEHKKAYRQGVWDRLPADQLSKKLTDVINAYPQQISHIQLLGCQSGTINSKLSDTIRSHMLFFKYSEKHEIEKRDMHVQRNRAIYVSEAKESVFDPESLAYQILEKLTDKAIAVTATPRLLYPYPPEEPLYFIGSDSKDWKDKTHNWDQDDNDDEFVVLLNKVKSVTQINESEISSHPKAPWLFRKPKL